MDKVRRVCERVWYGIQSCLTAFVLKINTRRSVLYLGPIYMLQVLGQKICIVSTTDAATDLLNVRALNYSERPRMPMVKELYVLPHCAITS
jgi:hypothetical protein